MRCLVCCLLFTLHPHLFRSSCSLSVLGVPVRKVSLRESAATTASPTTTTSSSESAYSYVVRNALDIPKTSNFLATQVWSSALHAARVLQTSSSRFVKDMVVCEFGCGPGLPSITAAKCCGASIVYATDCDEFALELVQKAAEDQNVDNILSTRNFDLVNSYVDEIPFADLYILSDVFETNAVAEGAATVTAEILLRSSVAASAINKSSFPMVWVFAQTDRAQRAVYQRSVQALLADDDYTALDWKPFDIDYISKQTKAHNQRLFLWDVNELEA